MDNLSPGNRPIFSSWQELRPEDRAFPARYRFCLAYLTSEDKVLDCTCGCGYGSALLAEKVAQVIGLENEDLVTFARQCWSRPNIQYQVLDISCSPLPFEEGAFSAITCFETISRVAEPDALFRDRKSVV